MNIEKGTNNVSRAFPKSIVPFQSNISKTKNSLDRFSTSSYQKTLIIRMIHDLLTQLNHTPKVQPQHALLSLVKSDVVGDPKQS